MGCRNTVDTTKTQNNVKNQPEPDATPEISAEKFVDDISRVICPANKKVAMLGHLSNFKNGLTCYGTHGFYSELGKAQDQLARHLVRKLNINTVKAELNNDPNFKNDARTGIYSTSLSEYLNSNPNKLLFRSIFHLGMGQ